MPDFLLIGKAVAASAVTAAVILLLSAWPWRAPHPVRLRLGWVLSLGTGFYAGCAVLDQWPRWPPVEDRHRLLTILLPLTLAVEAVTALAARPRWLAWLLRVGLAGAAAPILLHNSAYLADLAGPDSREWPPAQAAMILSALAAALLAVWGLLALLQARTSERAAAPGLVLACLAAGVTVILSGYLMGGLLALPLAAALAGATLASLVAPAEPNTSRYLGFGMVGLFSLLVIGHFFGSLPTDAAVWLLLAPLLAWVTELPGVRKLSLSQRALVRVALVAVPLVLVVLHAEKKFKEASVTPSSSSPYEPTLDDYKSFGK
jgi:hypothetical protein